MSNGVEVVVKDKSSDLKKSDQVIRIIIRNAYYFISYRSCYNIVLFSQRQDKLMHLSTSKQPQHFINTVMPKRSLISSAVATIFNQQQISAIFPLHQLMKHNYIIKTCLTTYTYLTTVIQNKRSAISTFETIVSVVTTETLTNDFATDLLFDIKPTKVRYWKKYPMVVPYMPKVTNLLINKILPYF